ncbi:MAG: aminoglycoside phosphotransferase family protein [Chloroflexi bacterium]|nr:aminoglycoside phosphotransferase family protein [Chloroflexota bacterium]
MSLLPPNTFQMLYLLLQQTFGSTVQVEECQVVNDQQDYWALIIQLRRPSIKVSMKLAGPNAPSPYSFDRIAVLHRLVSQHTTIPMPEIVAVDTSYRQWPWRYLIKTYIPGQEWAVIHPHLTTDELIDAYRQVGRAVAELHSLSFSGFGDFLADGTVQVEDSFLTALAHRVERHIASPRLVQCALSVLESHADLFIPVEARLCHEDLHKYNILFHQVGGRWQLATLLDFDKAWAGHHEIDLARMELWHGQTGEGFWAAYEEIIPRDPLYVQRRPVYQFIWCLEYADDSPEHLKDTRRLCDILGLPPITDFL